MFAYFRRVIYGDIQSIILMSNVITIFLCGDVMTGRGVDQVLPYSNDPRIYEPYLKNARKYVMIAEQENGPLPDSIGFDYVWGDALGIFDRLNPDLKIINLETAITISDDHWKGKRINYRMHSKNIPVLTSAGIDFCSLANNHVLDWGYDGLRETLRILNEAGVRHAGAGENRTEAQHPATFSVGDKEKLHVFSYGTRHSGISSDWAAGEDQPGVNLLKNFSRDVIESVRENIQNHPEPDDIVIVSVHWGGNWCYEIPKEHRKFAHQLIDEMGVDIVHGHSSHHPKGIEVHNNKLILYGCGDFINDYEGIGGYEQFRDDLGVMYFPEVDPASGDLVRLQMIPTRIEKFQVHRASREDAAWLKEMFDREGNRLGTRTELTEDDRLMLRWE
ncbi:MAG TPA: CapA family protein [bacterium]|nr:CapA family protein [bacterium]